MKKFALTAIALSVVSLSATAAPFYPEYSSSNNNAAHNRFEGVVDNFNSTITDRSQVLKIAKYTDIKTAAKLVAAYDNDGILTPSELKETGISDHHFYTGLLSSATSQKQYDDYMELMNNGQNTDDLFASNRDVKAQGTMIMNQVEKLNDAQNTAIKVANDKQDVASKEAHDALNSKLDNVTSGLQQLGNHVANNTGTGGEGESNQAQVDKNTADIGTNAGNIETNKNDIATNKDNITTNSNNIQAMGDAFVGRVDTVNGYLEQVGNAIKNTSNAGLADRMDTLEGAFAAQAEQTAQEIGRLDGRIDELEQKTDKMKAGIAGATAIASLTQYTGNGTHHVAVGVGAYDGAAALAAGYTYAVSKQTTVRATLALDSEKEVTIGASVGHSW